MIEGRSAELHQSITGRCRPPVGEGALRARSGHPVGNGEGEVRSDRCGPIRAPWPDHVVDDPSLHAGHADVSAALDSEINLRTGNRSAESGYRASAEPGELLGDYANGGSEWQPGGEPTRVNVHDFADRTLGEFAKARGVPA
jgi:hypothetical protein